MNTLYAWPYNLSLAIFLLGCVLLDALFGDPEEWPHPVRLQGAVLRRLEPWARSFCLGPGLGGFLAVSILALGSMVVVWVLTRLPFLGELAALYLGYAGLALGCLVREVTHVLSLVDDGRFVAARDRLATLVSRETDSMDEEEICRALGETLAENFNDGFVAPFFWLALFGPMALWGYKAVSTIDSMWGYRTQALARLGYAGARADDLLAWIPARLSAVLLYCVGLMQGRFFSWQKMMMEARTMDSPNAGWPMSAAAHVALVSMGGPTTYHGEIKEKPWLGPVGQAWSTDAVRRIRKSVIMAAFLGTLFLTVAGSFLSWWSLG